MPVRMEKSELAKLELDCAVREATFGDFEAICQVKRRNGLSPEITWVGRDYGMKTHFGSNFRSL